MPQLKTIEYRGGIARFQVPASWVEEYEPRGGGTFYEPGDDTGTLRINVLHFEHAPDDKVAVFNALDLARFTQINKTLCGRLFKILIQRRNRVVEYKRGNCAPSSRVCQECR